jgi:hypothetical protein
MPVESHKQQMLCTFGLCLTEAERSKHCKCISGLLPVPFSILSRRMRSHMRIVARVHVLLDSRCSTAALLRVC